MTITGTTAHTGYWISGDYFRQTSRRESAGDAGESGIERETRRDMRDNEAKGIEGSRDEITKQDERRNVSR